MIADVANVHPKDSFFARFDESCRDNPAKRRAYRSYDDALRLRLPIRPKHHELVRNVDAQARCGRKVIENAEGVHELLAHPALVRQGVDARMFYREIAGDGLDDELAWMVILRPRVDLEAWVFVVPKVLHETFDDLPVGRNPL